MLDQCKITHSFTFAILSTSTHSYTKVERGTERARCVSLEDNPVTLLEPGLLDPETSFNCRCGSLVGFESFYQNSHYTRCTTKRKSREVGYTIEYYADGQ